MRWDTGNHVFFAVFLLPFIFLIVAVNTVTESLTTNGAAANDFTEPMEDESYVLTPEVLAKVDANWLLALHITTAKRRARCEAIQGWQ